MKPLTLALLFAFPLLASADPTPERFALLIRDLSDESSFVRDAAEAELGRLPSRWKPALVAALREATDPEAAARLDQLAQSCGRPAWFRDIDAAIAEAQRSERPLLVVSTLGNEWNPQCPAGHFLRTVTFADTSLGDWLNQTFVLAWFDRSSAVALPRAWSPEEIASVPPNDTSIRTFYCTPDGHVRHSTRGHRGPKEFRAEAMEALEFVRADVEAAWDMHAKRVEQLNAQSRWLMEQYPEEKTKPTAEAPHWREAMELAQEAQARQEALNWVNQPASQVVETTRETSEDCWGGKRLRCGG